MEYKSRLIKYGVISSLLVGTSAATLEATYPTGVKGFLEERVVEPVKNTADNTRDNLAYYRNGIDLVLDMAYESAPEKPSYLTLDYLRRQSRIESSHNPGALNGGLFQIWPLAWADAEPNLEYNDENVGNPVTNTKAAINYHKIIDAYFRKKHPHWEELSLEEQGRIALMAYNAGPSRVFNRNWDIERMPKETQDYLKKFLK